MIALCPSCVHATEPASVKPGEDGASMSYVCPCGHRWARWWPLSLIEQGA